jgi:hypothetical protein
VNGTWSVTLPGNLPPGAHAVTVTATDLAGNTTGSRSPQLVILAFQNKNHLQLMGEHIHIATVEIDRQCPQLGLGSARGAMRRGALAV